MTLNNVESHTSEDVLPAEDPYGFDFTFVPTTARIALYDDLRSAPRVMEVAPSETTQYIEALASTIYEQARNAGGSIPYTVIREVSENFIHARFREIVVSVLDAGNTIRFADQGPGIPFKDQAQKPGFSSAVEPMKKYIRGVGSGLPIVRDYLDLSHGNITIEDNLGHGSVVTISVTPNPSVPPAFGLAPYGQQPAMQPGAGTPAYGAYPQAAPQGQPMVAGYAQAPAAGSHPVTYGAPVQAFDAYGNPLPPQQAAAYGGYGAPAVPAQSSSSAPTPPLNDREQAALLLLLTEEPLGVTEISKYLDDLAMSSTHKILTNLEQAGLLRRDSSKKRWLTEVGKAVAQTLSTE